jgi:hypothetical protein
VEPKGAVLISFLISLTVPRVRLEAFGKVASWCDLGAIPARAL